MNVLTAGTSWSLVYIVILGGHVVAPIRKGDQ